MVVAPWTGRPAYRLYRLAWAGLDWLYPPQCGGCAKPFTRWCSNCDEAIGALEGPLCTRCGGVGPEDGECARCRGRQPAFHAARSVTLYAGPIRNAIQRLKYAGDLALGEILARRMLDLLASLKWRVDLVVPVPSSLARRKMRGYNQASLLAMPVALEAGLPYRPAALRKVKDTPTQVGLTVPERRENVRDAFQAARRLVAGKQVLVIDDVMTSGATMDACAQALLDQGARLVYGLTLTRAAL